MLYCGVTQQHRVRAKQPLKGTRVLCAQLLAIKGIVALDCCSYIATVILPPPQDSGLKYYDM